MLFPAAVFTLLLCALSLATCPLDKILEAQPVIHASEKPTLHSSWGIGNETLSIDVVGDKIHLKGARVESVITASLTPHQLEFLKRFTMRNEHEFLVNASQDSNLSALKRAVNYAKLHSAFYSSSARPIEAAQQIQALVQRSSSKNPHLKITVREAPTQAENLEGIHRFAAAADAVLKLNNLGKLDSAVQSMKRDEEMKTGRKILDSILGVEKEEIGLDDVIRETELREKQANPQAVVVTFDYSHDTPKTVHLERSSDGRLVITTNAGVMVPMKDLKSLVEWLQGKGFDGESYDWRSYEKVDGLPFNGN